MTTINRISRHDTILEAFWPLNAFIGSFTLTTVINKKA